MEAFLEQKWNCCIGEICASNNISKGKKIKGFLDTLPWELTWFSSILLFFAELFYFPVIVIWPLVEMTMTGQGLFISAYVWKDFCFSQHNNKKKKVSRDS